MNVLFMKMTRYLIKLLLLFGLCSVIHSPYCPDGDCRCLDGTWIEYVPCVGASARVRADSIDINIIQSVRGVDIEYNKTRYNTRRFLRSVWI